MKKTTKLLTCGTSVLFAAALGLQAQTSSGASGTTGASSTSNAGSGASSTANAGTSGSSLNGGSSTQSSLNAGSSGSQSSSQFGSTDANSSMNGSGSTATSPAQSTNQNTSGSFNGSASGSAAGSLSGSASTNSSMQSQASQSTSPSITYPASGTTTQSTYANTANSTNANVANSTNTTTSTQNFFSGAATSDAQVTTFVQQLDAQGPAVVQRVSTQVGELACSNDTIENLVNALHSGQTVTINANGKSATFNPQGAHMGYGEAYIALALAAQELRNAGITSCATPEQWQAVLLGGPLNVSQTSSGTNTYASASSSNTVQGIVTLHNQGQGWGQIAQSANVQLGQIVSNGAVSSNVSTATNEASPSPTGYSSAEMNRHDTNVDSDNGKHKGEKKHHWWNREKKEDKDENKDNNASSSTDNNGFSSTHADTTGNANSPADSTSTPSTK